MRDTGGVATSDRGRPWSRGSGDRTTTNREPRIERERQPRRDDSQRGDRETSVRPERDRRQGNDRGNRGETWNRDRGTRDETGDRDTTRGDRNRTWNRDNDRNTTRGDRNGTWNRDNHRGDRGGTWNRDHSNHGNRNGSWQRPPSRDRYGRQAHYGRGHVSRCERYGSGYRVWISGSRYPFFVPIAYYNSHRFRVGIALDLWGYYNPLGYYEYYDTGYRGVRSEFRGVVEEVDYRRDRLVVRNEDTGNFVTVNLSSRRFDDVRPGDYVWIEGDWTRSSVFIAYDLRLIDDDRYDTYER